MVNALIRAGVSSGGSMGQDKDNNDTSMDSSVAGNPYSK